VFNLETVKITLQKMGDQILYLTVVLENMLHVLILALALCVRVCGCAEKSHSNERAARTVITNQLYERRVLYGFSLLIES
jgi:hypothetical protein